MTLNELDKRMREEHGAERLGRYEDIDSPEMGEPGGFIYVYENPKTQVRLLVEREPLEYRCTVYTFCRNLEETC